MARKKQNYFKNIFKPRPTRRKKKNDKLTCHVKKESGRENFGQKSVKNK